MADRQRVLITGVAGQIGSVVADALRTRHDVTGIDLKESPTVPTLVANMGDLENVAPAFEGIDTVVDLANLPAGDTPWNLVYENNIRNIYHALEAARRAGVRRVVFASSNRAAEGYEFDEPYASICAGRYQGLTPGEFAPVTAQMPPRPSGPYGIAKVMGEAAGRYFVDYHGLSVICLRLGTVTRANRPANVRHFATILTHRDLGFEPVDNMETYRAEWDAAHPQ